MSDDRLEVEAKIIGEVAQCLADAERSLSIAIGKIGPRAGGFRDLIGSLGDYKDLVRTLLKLQDAKAPIDRAVQRYEYRRKRHISD